jgi:hypothetical protein
MKSGKTFLILLWTLFLFGTLLFGPGCKKSDDAPPDCLLKRINTTYENGENTVMEFFYNDEKLLVNTLLSPLTPDKDFIAYMYNTDGKVSRETIYLDSLKNYESLYTYQDKKATVISSGRAEDGTWYPDFWKGIYEFDDSGQPISLKTYYKQENGTWGYSSLAEYTWENGNFVKKEVYGNVKAGEAGSFSKLLTNKFSLTNPSERSFRDMNVRHTISTYKYDDKRNIYTSLQSINFFNIAKNNITSEVKKNYGSSVKDIFTFKYEYNNEGFPVQLNYSNMESSYTEEYEYICE